MTSCRDIAIRIFLRCRMVATDIARLCEKNWSLPQENDDDDDDDDERINFNVA